MFLLVACVLLWLFLVLVPGSKDDIPLAPQPYPRFPKYVDWTKIDLSEDHKFVFGKDFLFGVSIAEYQNSGESHVPDSNWSEFERKPNAIKHNQRSASACDHKSKFETDVEMTASLGLNAFRFDLNWALCEPEEGKWSDDALLYYHRKLNAMKRKGIEPMITLHHFVHPLWFEQKGGFERQENIPYFVRFATKMVDEFGHAAHLWSTFNEPNVYVSAGYLRGVFPPAKLNVALAGQVMIHLLEAHKQAYESIKARKPDLQVGIVLQYLMFEPFHHHGLTAWLERKVTNFLSHAMTTAIWDFFKTGTFTFQACPLVNTVCFGNSTNWRQHAFTECARALSPISHRSTYRDPMISQRMDWIGLNYYSHILFDIYRPSKPRFRHHDIPTDMWYAIYAEGLYHAIHEFSVLQKPIYVTENGMADNSETGERREICIRRNLYALSRAFQDGYDVRGYFYWTLQDNFEWDEGFQMKYGLYDRERRLKKGSAAYRDIVTKSIRI